MTATKRNGRTRRERLNADNLKAQRLQPCRRCGQRINYDAPPEDPDSFNAGHIRDWKNHPELREDPSNLQPEHDNCNSSAGQLDGRVTNVGATSRAW